MTLFNVVLYNKTMSKEVRFNEKMNEVIQLFNEEFNFFHYQKRIS